ncbi:CapA family protein [Aggregatilinea lenta]|uniref:CapA family protein n=1 Tax=Aggregatilinea lenta TaxID=913108 RepID=UPI000E5C0F25|nr:CapA family protein [Aggregatilinea lenta]
MHNALLFLGDWYSIHQETARDAVEQYPFVFNLEGPISRRGAPAPDKIPLRMEQNRILTCFGRKPAAVCLANNHIADYGDEALEDTLAELRALKIPFFGAGNESNGYNNPAIITVGDYRIALLGYVCRSTHPIFAGQDHDGVCDIDVDRIAHDIRRAREQEAARVVVCLHWGQEDILLPTPQDVKTAHQIIEKGADAIIGHHAHAPQPIEIYQGKTIAYGLGNLLMSHDDVLVHMTGDRTPSDFTFSLRKRYWNRVSWGLIWNPADLTSRTKQFYFDDQVVFERPFKRALDSINVASKLYPVHFRLHIPLHTLLSIAPDYVRNPARLRPRHLASAFQILLRVRRS